MARRREQIARVFAYVADVTYVGRAALLALGALVLLGATALTLGRSVVGGGLPSEHRPNDTAQDLQPSHTKRAMISPPRIFM